LDQRHIIVCLDIKIHEAERVVIELLQQVVGCQLDGLVPPLAGPIDAGDQPTAVDAAQIPHHEGVPALGLVGRLVLEPEVPGGVLMPGVPLQVGVLDVGGGLHLSPVAVKDVLALRDQVPGVRERHVVDGVARHGRGYPWMRSRQSSGTRPAGPGVGWSAGCAVGGASSGPTRPFSVA
jgi:hypothetical protein